MAIMIILSQAPDASGSWFWTSKDLVLLYNHFSWLKASSLAVETWTDSKLSMDSQLALELPWWKRGISEPNKALGLASIALIDKRKHHYLWRTSPFILSMGGLWFVTIIDLLSGDHVKHQPPWGAHRFFFMGPFRSQLYCCWHFGYLFVWRLAGISSLWIPDTTQTRHIKVVWTSSLLCGGVSYSPRHCRRTELRPCSRDTPLSCGIQVLRFPFPYYHAWKYISVLHSPNSSSVCCTQSCIHHHLPSGWCLCTRLQCPLHVNPSTQPPSSSMCSEALGTEPEPTSQSVQGGQDRARTWCYKSLASLHTYSGSCGLCQGPEIVGPDLKGDKC